MNKDDMKKLLPLERMVIMQGFVEVYLQKTKGKKFGELYPDIEDTYGVLNKKQLEILHSYLVDDYKSMNIDLNEIINKSGSAVDENGLSEYEKKELVRRADSVLATVANVFERKEKLYKNIKNVDINVNDSFNNIDNGM